MKSEIQIKNSAGVCRIEIEGTIGVPEEWQFDQPEARVATYEKFRDTVQRIAGIDAPQIVVDIRSTGGDVNDALLIHDALCSLDAHIITRCYGYTASAATIIAQAASPGCREISANALYLIHTAICAAEGNAAEIAGKLDLLRQTDTRIAAVYAARSGRPAGEFEALMAENNGNGRWLSPEEAVAAGLADTVTDNGSARHPRWQGISPAAGSGCSQASGSTAARSFPPTAMYCSPRENGRSCCAARPRPYGKRSRTPRPPAPNRAKTRRTATRCGRRTNAPTPKTSNASKASDIHTRHNPTPKTNQP